MKLLPRALLTYLICIGTVFIALVLPAYPGSYHLAGALIFSALVAVFPTMLHISVWNLSLRLQSWNPQQAASDTTDDRTHDTREKRKRDRLDAVLRDLSDEELHRLRLRLSDQTITDDDLYERMMIGDDGEISRRTP